MVDEELLNQSDEGYTQLMQVRVPLREASVALTTRDQGGRIPIILVPQQTNRIRNELVLIGIALLVGSYFIATLLNNVALATVTTVLGVLLLILGVYRSFIVRIPEGANALLTRGGRYVRTEAPGSHILAPWFVVSHLVTTREIPFDVPIVEAPTSDNVRANVDTLITFRISDPYKFVYNISVGDFDHVFQSSCQDGLRGKMREIMSQEVFDLKKADLADMMTLLTDDVAPYGVTVTNINVTFAQPPAEFMASREARQLAILQQLEQEERQNLAERRQHDADALNHQKTLAMIERERQILQLEYQKAEARKRVNELEAEAEALRLARLQERLQDFPAAAAYDVGQNKLDIAKALAGNTRAMLQVGTADDIVRAFVMRDVLSDIPVPPDDEAAPGNGESA